MLLTVLRRSFFQFLQQTIPLKPLYMELTTIFWTEMKHVISNASCTTNNAAPMIDIIQELCGIKQAYITTIHSYTTIKAYMTNHIGICARARAAGQSIVPTTTGAAKALTKIFPELSNVIGGLCIRVPVANGSLQTSLLT